MYSFVKTFFQKISEGSERQGHSIATISLIGAIAAWVALPAYYLAGVLTGEIQYQYLTTNGLVLAIGLSLAYGLARLKIKLLPIWLTAISLEAGFAVLSIYMDGLGVILAIVIIGIIANIAIQGLIKQATWLMIITAILSAVVYVSVDFLNLSALRTSAPFWLQQGAIVMGGLVILFSSINTLRVLEFASVRTQLSVAFLLIAIVPLMVVLSASFLTQEQALQTIEANEVRQSALLLRTELGERLDMVVKDVEFEATLPIFKDYLEGNSSIEVLSTLNALAARDSFIMSYGLINPQGRNVADTASFRVGQSQADAVWFTETLQTRGVYISDVVYDPNLVRPVFYVSAPVLNEAQELVGVLRVQYDSDLIREMLLARINQLDNTFTAVIADSNGIVISHTQQPNLHQKTISTLEAEQVLALQQNGQLPPGTAQSLSAGLTNLAPHLDGDGTETVFNAPLEPDSETNAYFAAVPVSHKNWVLFAGQAQRTTVQSILQDNTIIILIAGLTLLSVLLAAAGTSGVITAPINSLSAIAQEIGKGNLNISSGIVRKDELGTLAQIFDKTTDQLRNILQNLETRVNERTAELGKANKMITQRAEQLKIVSGVARAISNLKNLEILLPQITEEISKALGYYHVGIFLIDPSGQYAVLQAANSEGGQNMLARGHKLRVGQTGIVGYTTGLGRARIALDVGDDATFFNNPDLPHTRSEMALPLKSGNTIIGALDLQSQEPAAFSKEDIEVLSLLADQISSAIQNSRVFEETQEALAEAQLIFSKNVQNSWREIMSNEKSTFGFINGKVVELKPNGETDKQPGGSMLELPILIRGEKLGTLRIRTQREREWDEQDVRIYQSIVDRLSFALENARLFRNAQRLVSKEQLIGEITDKISRSVNLDNILQTAVEELGHVITDSEVTIQVGEHESSES